ncbi:uncharacterized protein LOC101742982 [Bombyx mori]|uniref:Cuticle protein n=1 Tax=Bombyx mori TaxID=7091 RepID=A0A8R2R767_BOMMO|nr:uncharacterized protein LOC101742982 [Bombyx mori]
MRLFTTILCCAILATTFAGPEPKKYKVDVKDKDKVSNSTLTDDEKKFLREVEAKFGVKPDEDKNNKNDESNSKTPTPFPAVIAIEIVNDTDSKSKGKRTIDANLGYGYRTNNGYTYSYFGKPVQEKGRFMIYPYSQDDIVPTTHHYTHHTNAGGRYTTVATKVEIQPSQAFELVPVKEENVEHQGSSVQSNSYDNIKGLVSPPPSFVQGGYSHVSSPVSTPSTLYTTYNGQSFSGLSGQFPSVMSNYLVEPSQLLKRPEFQGAGLTTDHIHSLQGSTKEQGVVPVLVLRIPSSSLKNPTAELFANLPDNYPFSRYLNNVNLQELVNEYFKKIGYSFAPQVMTYQESLALKASEALTGAPVHEPNQYAVPYVQPSYTHSDHSGVQYSAVKPVMARYPSSYVKQQYYPQGHSHYRQPVHQPRYEYRYKYVPQSRAPTQTYYVQPQYQQQVQPAHVTENQQTLSQTYNAQDTSVEVQYNEQSHVNNPESVSVTYEYRQPEKNIENQYETQTASPDYAAHAVTASVSNNVSPVYGLPETSSPTYREEQTLPKENVVVYPSEEELNQEPQRQLYSQPNLESSQEYIYRQQSNENSNDLVLTENYPSKDHTVATVLPLSYKSKQTTAEGPVQTVSYVTPMPYSYKYQSPYRVMVPQTFLRNPATAEKVSYVNSQSMHTSQNQEDSSEVEYTVPAHYIPPVGKQKPPSYPRNYHSYPKRMTRPENKRESIMTRKQNQRKEMKKSSS